MCFYLVMSQTFTLTGRSSVLSVDFYPPIQLDSKFNYSLALIGFHTYNSIPNIEDGVNNSLYISADNKSWTKVSVPTGAYEIADIENFIQKKLCSKESGCVQAARDQIFSLKPNNNTLKCELKSIFHIDFRASDSLGQLLGFSPRILPQLQTYESDLPVNIIKVATIRIECNISSGCFYGNKPSHTIFEFAPSVDPGYAINIEPNNYIYLPIINKNLIDNITIRILDQNGDLVNFRNEEVVVRLELRKNGPSY